MTAFTLPSSNECVPFPFLCQELCLCTTVLAVWFVTCGMYTPQEEISVSGQVTQLATPPVHHLLPYFVDNFCSSLHYLTAKMGWHTGMSHPHLFSCYMRDILQQSSKVQAWTFVSLNQYFPQFYAQFYWSCQNLQKTSYISHEYMFMVSTQCPKYVFTQSINSVVANVLCSCNWISEKQKIYIQL